VTVSRTERIVDASLGALHADGRRWGGVSRLLLCADRGFWIDRLRP